MSTWIAWMKTDIQRRHFLYDTRVGLFLYCDPFLWRWMCSSSYLGKDTFGNCVLMSVTTGLFYVIGQHNIYLKQNEKEDVIKIFVLQIKIWKVWCTDYSTFLNPMIINKIPQKSLFKQSASLCSLILVLFNCHVQANTETSRGRNTTDCKFIGRVGYEKNISTVIYFSIHKRKTILT